MTAWPPSLAELPNLGAKSRDLLVAVGIDSPGALGRVGAVAAFAAVRRAGTRPPLNLLWALEGAITGQRWQDVARLHRTRLLVALDDHERRSATAPGDPGPTSSP